MAKQLPLQFEFRANQTFEDFFPSTNNEVINHLQKASEGLGERQTFLWGSSGLGKSHLLQACCHRAESLNLSSFYFSFSALELPDPDLLIGLDEFDMVCLDNIENLAGNAAWESAFFNFFNQHRDQDHILILSANCAPNQIAIQLPDLKTRLNWGLTLKLQALSDHEKINTLIFKADKILVLLTDIPNNVKL